MKRFALLAMSLAMVLALAACGGDRMDAGDTAAPGGANSGTTNGTTNGVTNGTANGTTNGVTNGAANGATNGVTDGGLANGGVTGPAGGDHRDVIGSDLDDMVRDGIADDRDGNLNREP